MNGLLSGVLQYLIENRIKECLFIAIHEFRKGLKNLTELLRVFFEKMYNKVRAGKTVLSVARKKKNRDVRKVS